MTPRKYALVLHDPDGQPWGNVTYWNTVADARTYGDGALTNRHNKGYFRSYSIYEFYDLVGKEDKQ